MILYIYFIIPYKIICCCFMTIILLCRTTLQYCLFCYFEFRTNYLYKIMFNGFEVLLKKVICQNLPISFFYVIVSLIF